MPEHYIPENIFTLHFSLAVSHFTNTAVYEWRKTEAKLSLSLENTQVSQGEEGSTQETMKFTTLQPRVVLA